MLHQSVALSSKAMLAEAAGEIGESKAAELLGMNVEEYRNRRYDAIHAVLQLIENLPSPLVSIIQIVDHQPGFFND